LQVVLTLPHSLYSSFFLRGLYLFPTVYKSHFNLPPSTVPNHSNFFFFFSRLFPQVTKTCLCLSFSFPLSFLNPPFFVFFFSLPAFLNTVFPLFKALRYPRPMVRFLLPFFSRLFLCSYIRSYQPSPPPPVQFMGLVRLLLFSPGPAHFFPIFCRVTPLPPRAGSPFLRIWSSSQ